MLVDSHAHLDDRAFDGDREAVIDRARQNGLTRIVTVGTDHASCERAVAIAGAHDFIFAALGYHPHEADRYRDDDLSRLRALCGSPKVVAIGETGLDYAKKFASVDGQKRLFRLHLALARDLGKPVVIHCRDAHADTRAILREEGISRGVIHCFSGNDEDARDYASMGFLLSIAGPVTFANADRLRDTVRAIPLDRLLVETDCPLLTPVPHRGKRNEPSYVMYTAAAVARAHDTSPERVAELTTRNALDLFRIA
jgi:TatD DNase family protein